MQQRNKRRKTSLQFFNFSSMICLFLFILLSLRFLLPTDLNASTNPESYHAYGQMTCSDCHLVFGEPGIVATAGNPASLKVGDITDLCLSCHTEGNNTPLTSSLPGITEGNWVAPIVMTLSGQLPAELNIAMPAGDFFWSKENPNFGHNPAFYQGQQTSLLMQSDPDLRLKPPGGYLVDGDWSCTSCHGVHDRFADDVSAWRQLKREINGQVVTGDVSRFGVENTPGSLKQNASFEPIKSNSRGIYAGINYYDSRADGRALDGADLFLPESDHNKNVYRGGFSSFCAACHGDFHDGGTPSASQNRTQNGAWLRHPTNLKMGESVKYGLNAYAVRVVNAQGVNPNPVGYDWKYPLVKVADDFSITAQHASALKAETLSKNDRIMCLTCHKAHATTYENMTRWDARGHSFIGAGETDFSGEVLTGDNPAYGCGKCHQMGGKVAFVRRF